MTPKKLKTERLSVTYVPVADLKPASYNPRKIDESTIEQLKTSISKHGLVDPIIVNSSPKRYGTIVGGHMRARAAEALGMESVPVIFVRIDDIEKEKALNLRLNRVHAEFDLDLLKKFDLSLLLETGFDSHDLDQIWSDVLSVEDDGADVEKMVHEIKKPKSKFGDYYELGQHRLYCNDSGDPEAVKKLVNGNVMDLVTLDPVYRQKLDYSKGVATSGKYGGTEKDDMNPAEYRAFLKKVFENALSVSKKDLHFYCWNSQLNIGLVQSLAEEAGLSNKSVCLWLKNNFSPVPGIAWNRSYEACVHASRGKPFLNPDVRNLTEILNKNVDPGNRQIDDIVGLFDVWLVKRLPAQEYQHCTQKPLDVYEKPFRRCAKVGSNVLELFNGSGTCLLAAHQMHMRAFCMERDPIFVDVCLRRFEEMTGIKPKKLN